MRALVIQNPPFVIYSDRRLSQSAPKHLQGINHQVHAVSLKVFAAFQPLWDAFKKASHYCGFYVVFALRITLEIYPMFVAPLATLLKTACIALGVFWGGMTLAILLGSTAKGFIPQAMTKEAGVTPYVAGSRIDPQHFKAVDTKVSVGEVPQSVKLQDFLTVLEQIPTEASELREPGYIETTYSAQGNSRQKLREGLNIIVNNINTEANWAGVPRDFKERQEFYKKLKELLLCSFHKVTSDYSSFVAEHGIPKTPTEESSEEEKKLHRQYLDFLETRNSFVVDIAFAGLFCGGGVMGEALDAHLRLTKSSQTLQGKISSLLVDKRLEIIRADVYEIARQDPNYALGPQSSHYFSAYLTKLGEILGIPGSEAAKEHMRLFLNAINPRMRLVKFFGEYTSELMIKVVVDAYSASEDFRILVQDWLKERVGDWNIEKYRAIQTQIVSKVEKMFQEQRFETGAQSKAAAVVTWLEHLKNHDPEAWNEAFVCRNGVWFIKNEEEETALEANSLEKVLEGLFSLSNAQKHWVGEQEPLVHLNTLKDLLSHLLKKEHAIEIQGEAPLNDLLDTIISNRYARDWLLKKFPVGEASGLEKLRQKERETLERWKQGFSFVDNASYSGLKSSLRQYIVETQQKHPHAQMTWQLIERVAKQSKLNSWKREITHPEFLAFFQGFLKGDMQKAQGEFTKKIKASAQVTELSQSLQASGALPIPAEMKGVFVEGMMEDKKNRLYQTIENHLQRSRQAEFLSGVLTKEDVPEEKESGSLKRPLAEWMLIELGFLLF